jgi:hypothetical protein
MSRDDTKKLLVEKVVCPLAESFKDQIEIDSTVVGSLADALADWLTSDNRDRNFSLHREKLALSARISEGMLQVLLQKAAFQLEGQSPQPKEAESVFGSRGPGLSILESSGRFLRAEIPLKEILEHE